MITIQAGTISRCHKYLDSIGKINQKSVQNLPPEVKDALREVTPKRLKELAQMNCYAANKIKTELNQRYGENNYVIIAIGRSISSIAETLCNMGVDTKIIPISGLRNSGVENIPKEDLHIYKTFLVQKGLSKTDLDKNMNKKYIIMDYAYYGRTLDRATELLKKNELLGNKPNLISISINDILGEDFNKKQFRTLFQYNRFKDYSYVGKLHVNNIKDVFQQCSPERIREYQGNITQGLRRLFWFNVFDYLNKQNFNDILPMKELNALQKHYMSLKAIRNYKAREQKKYKFD